MTDEEHAVMAQALTRCEGYFDLGMHQQAWDELEEIAPEYRADYTVLLWRMQILWAMGEYEKATYLCETLRTEFPHKVSAPVVMSDCYSRMARHVEAVNVLYEAMRVNPNSGDLLLALARAQAMAGLTWEAKKTLAKLAENHPETRLAALDVPEIAELL